MTRTVKQDITRRRDTRTFKEDKTYKQEHQAPISDVPAPNHVGAAKLCDDWEASFAEEGCTKEEGS